MKLWNIILSFLLVICFYLIADLYDQIRRVDNEIGDQVDKVVDNTIGILSNQDFLISIEYEHLLSTRRNYDLMGSLLPRPDCAEIWSEHQWRNESP